MDYDYRNRTGPPYNPQIPVYGRPPSPSPSTHPMYGPSPYPRVGAPSHPGAHLHGRNSSHHQTSAPSATSGLGVRVAIKPEYRISLPPQMSPNAGDIHRSSFQFDFDFERKIIAEAEKDNQNWSKLGLESLPSKTTEEPTSSLGSVADPVVSKYITSGLNREAVPLAVSNYGDNPTKVREFVDGYMLLREMGFSSSNVAEALVTFDNNTDKALAHFLNNS